MAGAAAKGVSHLAKNITCHAWNPERNKLALCPGNNEVWIFNYNGSQWSKDVVLTEHDQLVTSIHWGAKKNRLVTCSEDRNAYVWTWDQAKGVWHPKLVILRINRAAYCARWSANEDKFAVASGAKVVSVCYFEQAHDWWVSKHIKKHKSTVLTVDWHPNNMLLCTASTDFRCRIFSALVKGVDQRPKEPVLGFGTKIPFGECLLELDTANGWVHAALWSPSGNQVAFVGHDASLSVADVSGAEPQKQKIKHDGLPFQSLLWLNDTTIVAAGHECNPVAFKNQGGQWKAVKKLDDSGAGGGAAKAAPAQSATRSAFSKFQNQVDRGQNKREGHTLNTKHQNCITALSDVNQGQFASTGVDGKIVFWPKAGL